LIDKGKSLGNTLDEDTSKVSNLLFWKSELSIEERVCLTFKVANWEEIDKNQLANFKEPAQRRLLDWLVFNFMNSPKTHNKQLTSR
jgi:hypothetical protein